MDAPPFTIRNAIDGVLARKTMIITIFLVVLTLVGIATLMATKTYESQAKIFVRLGRENVGLDPTTTLGEGGVITTPMSREAEINSVVQMIRSRSIFENIVDEFGAKQILNGRPAPQEEPKSDTKGGSGFSIRGPLESIGVLNKVSLREQAVLKLAKNVSVAVLDRSNVIKVGYETESPQLAQDVVAFLLERYVDLHVKLHRHSGAYEFMEQQAEGIADELQQKEQQLEYFKIETGMISAELQKQSLVQRIATIKNQLRDAVVESTALQSEVDTMGKSFKTMNPTRLASKTTGAGNQAIDGMRQELYRQQIELAELRGRHTEQHPSVLALKAAIEKSKSILKEDEGQRTESILGANPAYSEIQVELLRKQSQLVAAKVKSKLLGEALAKELETQIEFSKRESEFVQLSRELEIKDESYRRYARSVAQATVDQSLEKNRLSNISISQPASFNEKPSRPNKLINLVAGLMLATLASFGSAIWFAYMDSTLRTQQQIETTLSLPTLATIPRLTPQRSS